MNSADGDTMFIEVRVTVDHEVVDALCDIIIENFSPGLILEDEEDSSVTTIKFYHPGSDADEYLRRVSAFLSRLPAFQTARTAEIRSRTVSSVDWEQQYRDSIESIGIEPGIVVRPPWQEPIGSALYDIVVEPKMAFGTGRHETTRCCLKVIAERFQPGWRFLDLGCGSGILSILADKLSASFIKGIDYDPEAVDNCRENFQLNNVAAPFEILLGSIELCRFDPPYQFVCVNIIKETILEMLPTLKDLTADDGIVLLAGLLARDQAEVRASFSKVGLVELATVADNEWLTFVLKKESA